MEQILFPLSVFLGITYLIVIIGSIFHEIYQSYLNKEYDDWLGDHVKYGHKIYKVIGVNVAGYCGIFKLKDMETGKVIKRIPIPDCSFQK